MPARIVKQPNGLWARFSTVVDSFTHMNMNDKEAREALVAGPFKRTSKEEVEKSMERAARDDVDGKAQKDDGLNRWRDSLVDIEHQHGKKEVERFIKMDKEGGDV